MISKGLLDVIVHLLKELQVVIVLFDGEELSVDIGAE